VQLAWDNSQLQPGQAGGLTIFTGGSKSAGMLSNPKPVQAQVYLKQLNKIYPSLQQFYNERFGMFYWPEHPHTLGSYACYKVGQWSAFAGIEAEPVGNLYFAGEHCSAGFQGYMEGAAETGVTAALAVLKAL
jgi:monoamine oxidase